MCPVVSVVPATALDAALVAVEVGAGRVVAFYDKDPWFNPGRPVAIDFADNARLADNVFAWLARRI